MARWRKCLGRRQMNTHTEDTLNTEFHETVTTRNKYLSTSFDHFRTGSIETRSLEVGEPGRSVAIVNLKCIHTPNYCSLLAQPHPHLHQSPPAPKRTLQRKHWDLPLALRLQMRQTTPTPHVAPLRCSCVCTCTPPLWRRTAGTLGSSSQRPRYRTAL